MRPIVTLLRLAAAAVVLTAATPARALDPDRAVDEFTVTGWTMQDGLPHNLVHQIAQDHDGFLWISTWEGAARFNGRSFTAFDASSAAGPGIVGVRGLLVEADGSILFGSTRAGVRRLQAGHWDALGGDDAQRLKVTNLLRDRDGALWIGTEDSLYRLERDGRLRAAGAQFGLPGNFIYALSQTRDGELLVGTSIGLHRLREGRFEPLGEALGIPTATIRTIVAAADGSLRVGGDGGAWRIDAALTHAERFFSERVVSIIEDSHQVLWISTMANGVARLRGDRLETIGAQRGIIGRGTSALFEDREGLIWVGTTNGLFRIADGVAHGLTHADGLRDDYVRSILETADGAIWIGHAVGVDRWVEGRMEHIDLAARGHPASSVLALAKANGGGVWLGTYDQGVLRIGGSDDPRLPTRLDRRDGLQANHVRAIAQTRDGTLWIGTSEGLAAWKDGAMRRFGRAEGLPSDYTRLLHEGRDGTLWIGTTTGIAALATDGGLRAWSSESGFPAEGVFDVLDDEDGTLWIATDHGIVRMRDGRFTRYDNASGLPSESVFRVLDDGLGTLWMSSNRGLFGVRRADFAALDEGRLPSLRVDVIDQADGMPSSQANGGSAPAGTRTRNGELWFPTAGGIAVLYPAQTGRASSNPVPIAFEQFSVNGAVRPLQPPMILPADTRRLAIDYAGISLRATRDVRYRYRLTGFDSRWLEAGSMTSAVFTNLPPGQFRFEVQAMRHPVDWNRPGLAEPEAIEIEIEAPFWRQSWFLAFVAIGLLALVVGLHRWRMASLRHREHRLADIVERRTRELSEKNVALKQVQRQHREALHQLSHQANHDVLTGLPNRRAGDLLLRERLESARRGGPSFCVGLLDIDHFKRINDEFGHDTGDAVIRMVAQVLREALGDEVFVGRHGGEEFLLSADCDDLVAMHARADALRRRIAATPVGTGDLELRCTVSIGIATWGERDDARGLLALADRRLYLAKQRGRDQVASDDG
ncbi:MAG: diguanylate cyclase [Xanthomonadales bacterium]|nr:diguanylate cyclase [Xanthomonadales bacterium]